MADRHDEERELVSPAVDPEALDVQPDPESPENDLPGAESHQAESGDAQSDHAPVAELVAEPARQPDEVPVRSSRKRRTARGAIVVSARVTTGIVGTMLAAAVIAAATWLPLPTVGGEPPAARIVPVAAAQQRICAGPVLRLGNEAGQDATSANSVGRPAIRFEATRGEARAEPLESTENTTGVAPQRVTLAPQDDGELAGILAAGQSQDVSAGGLDGFAAAECAKPASDTWLVGGATDTGRTTLLTLSNPHNVGSTVDLTIFSETGTVTAAGSEGIVVPPGTQRVLSLAGFAPGVVSPIVRVVSHGGDVVANLQQAVVRTLEPGGVDIIGASAEPSLLSVIPGFTLVGTEAVHELGGGPGFHDLEPAIRILVPGAASTEADITLHPEAEGAEPVTVNLTIPGGEVTDVPLGEFPEGSYTITVKTDLPAVVAARAATADSRGANDFAWFAAAPTLRDSSLVSVPEGPSPALHLANPGDTDAEVTIGDRRPVTVPAGGAVVVSVRSGNHAITGFDTLRAAVSYRGPGQLASFTLSPPEPVAAPITVFR